MLHLVSEPSYDKNMEPDQHDLTNVLYNLQQQVAQLQAQLHHQQPAAQATVKLAKPDTFNAERSGVDVETWLFQLQNYLQATATTEETKVSYAAALLRGVAATWYRYTVQSGTTFATFAAFSSAIREQFKPVNATKVARDKLANLRQTRSVQEYASAFRMIALEIPSLTEDEKLDRFVRGLKLNAQRELVLHPVGTLNEAVRIAERVDTIDFRVSRLARRLPEAHHVTRAIEAVPMELGAILQRKKLTAQERARLRQEGKCFYCREPGHLALQCPKRPQGNGYRQ